MSGITSRLLAFTALVCLSGCSSKSPEGKSPGEPAPPPPPTKAFIAMSDPAAASYIVRDISDTLESGTWRWTFDKPELKFFISRPENLKLQFDFTIADATFKTTGPVTVSFSIDGKPAGSIRCPKAGPYQFSAPVPAGWLHENTMSTVTATVDPLWTSPNDGRRLGMILIKAGFAS